MTLRIVLSVLEIVLLVVVLGFFLNRIARQLNSISKTLAKITFGVRAVETQCLAIGPAADRLNPVLADIADGVDKVANAAERLG